MPRLSRRGPSRFVTPRTWRSLSPRPEPLSAHRQRVDTAGDIGSHDHRVQRPVDAPARFEHRRHEAAFAQLGDLQLDIAAWVATDGRGARCAPSCDARCSWRRAPMASVASGLDQLQRQAHRVADQLRATTGAEGLPQLRCGSIRMGYCCVLLDELMSCSSPRITPMAPLEVDPLCYPNPHHMRGHCRIARCQAVLWSDKPARSIICTSTDWRSRDPHITAT